MWLLIKYSLLVVT